MVVFEVLEDGKESVVFLKFIFQPTAQRLHNLPSRVPRIILHKTIDLSKQPPHFTDLRKNIPYRRSQRDLLLHHIGVLHGRMRNVVAINPLEHVDDVLDQIALLEIDLGVALVGDLANFFDSGG